MSVSPQDIHGLVDKLRYDLTAMQAKVTDLKNMLAALNLPEPARYACPECGLACRGPASLAEHLYISHGGPQPPHWLEAEQKAGESR